MAGNKDTSMKSMQYLNLPPWLGNRNLVMLQLILTIQTHKLSQKLQNIFIFLSTTNLLVFQTSVYRLTT